MIHRFILIFLLTLWSGILTVRASGFTQTSHPHPLQQTLQNLTEGRQMDIGIAVILNGKDTVTVHNAQHYPLMSVFKFHQALAVVHELSLRHTSLDSLLDIPRAELREKTYSPLRDKYPSGNLRISLRELLEYTLLWSDNNACDILFDHILGVAQTAQYLESLGNADFAIRVNEHQMYTDPSAYLKNWTTPQSAVFFLERLLDGSVVKGAYQKFLVDTMLSCGTGKQRLPGFSGSSAVRLGHKTGTGGTTSDGILQAVNDIGFVFLPDGQYYTLAVFIKDSRESMTETEAVIAAVSEAVYRFMSMEKN